MTTQAEKFKEIADAIRIKTGGSDEIAANDFASEIRAIDRLKPMTNYPDGFTNGYYGNRAAKIAATYHLARALGEDTFNYSQTGNIFSNNTSATKTVRNDDGLGQIDCSSLVSLVLRGITYDKSPYALHKGANATWNPSKELSGMYGDDGWEFTFLDKQLEGFFNNLGIPGYSSVKSAADIGEYFYKYGYVIFDAKVDGEMTAEKAVAIEKQLEPGDLLFWSKPTASDAQKNRFRSISHTAMVAENTSHFLEVTTGESVVLYSTFDAEDDDETNDKFNYISLICRPDYRPRNSAEKISSICSASCRWICRIVPGKVHSIRTTSCCYRTMIIPRSYITVNSNYLTICKQYFLRISRILLFTNVQKCSTIYKIYAGRCTRLWLDA